MKTVNNKGYKHCIRQSMYRGAISLATHVTPSNNLRFGVGTSADLGVARTRRKSQRSFDWKAKESIRAVFIALELLLLTASHCASAGTWTSSAPSWFKYPACKQVNEYLRTQKHETKSGFLALVSRAPALQAPNWEKLDSAANINLIQFLLRARDYPAKNRKELSLYRDQANLFVNSHGGLYVFRSPWRAPDAVIPGGNNEGDVPARTILLMRTPMLPDSFKETNPQSVPLYQNESIDSFFLMNSKLTEFDPQISSETITFLSLEPHLLAKWHNDLLLIDTQGNFFAPLGKTLDFRLACGFDFTE